MFHRGVPSAARAKRSTKQREEEKREGIQERVGGLLVVVFVVDFMLSVKHVCCPHI